MKLGKYAILSLLVSHCTYGSAQTTLDSHVTGCSLGTVEAKEGFSRWIYSFGEFEARGYPVVAARPGCNLTHVYQIEPDWQYRIASVEGTASGQLSTGARADITISYFRERNSESEAYPPNGRVEASAPVGLNGTMRFAEQNPTMDWTPCGVTTAAYFISPRIRLIQAGAQDLLKLDQLQLVWEKRKCPRLPENGDVTIPPIPPVRPLQS